MNKIYYLEYKIPVSHKQKITTNFESEETTQEIVGDPIPVKDLFESKVIHVAAKNSEEAQMKAINYLQNIKHFPYSFEERYIIDVNQKPELTVLQIVVHNCIE